MSYRNKNRPGYNKTKAGDFFHNRKETGTSGLPVLSVTMNSGIVYRKTLDRKMAPDLLPEQSLLVEPGDIVYNMMRMWQGAVAVCKNRGVVSPAYVVCRPKGEIDSLFAYYLFKTPTMLHRLKSYSYGITGDRLRLYYKDFAAIPLNIPPLQEQNKIAEILSTWDEAIEQTRKLIDAKKRHKKALMQQLLTGKNRLAGFPRSKYTAYHFFDLPSDWECPQMKEIAAERSERNGEKEDMTVFACSKHLGFLESSKYFGKRVFSDDTSNYKVIRRGWFGFPSNHIEEGSIGLLSTHEIGLVSPIYTVFRCNDSVIPEYLYAVFKTETYRHIFAISTNASVDRRGSLRWKEFSLIRVPLPSIEEQRAIVDVLETVDNEIKMLEKKLSALEKQKRGLMQKLLTGEVRVKL